MDRIQSLGSFNLKTMKNLHRFPETKVKDHMQCTENNDILNFIKCSQFDSLRKIDSFFNKMNAYRNFSSYLKDCVAQLKNSRMLKPVFENGLYFNMLNFKMINKCNGQPVKKESDFSFKDQPFQSSVRIQNKGLTLPHSTNRNSEFIEQSILKRNRMIDLMVSRRNDLLLNLPRKENKFKFLYFQLFTKNRLLSHILYKYVWRQNTIPKERNSNEKIPSSTDIPVPEIHDKQTELRTGLSTLSSDTQNSFNSGYFIQNLNSERNNLTLERNSSDLESSDFITMEQCSPEQNLTSRISRIKETVKELQSKLHEELERKERQHKKFVEDCHIICDSMQMSFNNVEFCIQTSGEQPNLDIQENLSNSSSLNNDINNQKSNFQRYLKNFKDIMQRIPRFFINVPYSLTVGGMQFVFRTIERNALAFCGF